MLRVTGFVVIFIKIFGFLNLNFEIPSFIATLNTALLLQNLKIKQNAINYLTKNVLLIIFSINIIIKNLSIKKMLR